jgi:hypothetical protein
MFLKNRVVVDISGWHYRRGSSSLGTLLPPPPPILILFETPRVTTVHHYNVPRRRHRHVSQDSISPSPNTTAFLCPQDVYLSVPTPSHGRSHGTPFCRHPPCTATCSVYRAELMLGNLELRNEGVCGGVDTRQERKTGSKIFHCAPVFQCLTGRGATVRVRCTRLGALLGVVTSSVKQSLPFTMNSSC